MNILNEIVEFREIREEMKKVRGHLRSLHKRANVIENHIKNFLNEKEQPGVKYQDCVVVLNQTNKHGSKPRSEKEKDCLTILESQGDRDASKVLSLIEEARKGPAISHQKLVFKKA